jgi:hypothetical protein
MIEQLQPITALIGFIFSTAVALRVPTPAEVRGGGSLNRWVSSLSAGGGTVLAFLIALQFHERAQLVLSASSLLVGNVLLVGYNAMRPRRGVNSSITGLLSLYLTLLLVLSLFVGFLSATVLSISAEKGAAPSVAASVVTTGTLPVSELHEVPFQASSGQVNFGCEQDVAASASFALPPGAELVGDLRSDWRNTDNVGAQSSSPPTLQGNSVVGTGRIRGRNLERISLIIGSVANCPGGGHGELVISGRYRVTETTPRAQEPARTTTKVDISDNGAVTIVSLPRLESLVSTITFSPLNDDGTARPESFDSVRIAAVDGDKASDKRFFRATIRNGQLVMTVVDRTGIIRALEALGGRPGR